MTDLRVGSLVIGINDYRHEYYQNGEYKLEFAKADALAFYKYLVAAWPNVAPGNHILLCDQDALPFRIKNALLDLARAGPFDSISRDMERRMTIMHGCALSTLDQVR
jgi:hypothetical protein